MGLIGRGDVLCTGQFAQIPSTVWAIVFACVTSGLGNCSLEALRRDLVCPFMCISLLLEVLFSQWCAVSCV